MALKLTKLLKGCKLFHGISGDTNDAQLNELIRQSWNMANNRHLFRHQRQIIELRFGAGKNLRDLPEDFNEIKWITMEGETELDYISEAKWGADYQGQDVANDTGTPTDYRLPPFEEDEDTYRVQVWPTPTERATVFICYHAHNAELARGNDEMLVPSQWAYMIYMGVGALFYDNNPFRAAKWTRDFNKEVERFRKQDKTTEDQRFILGPDLRAYTGSESMMI